MLNLSSLTRFACIAITCGMLIGVAHADDDQKDPEQAVKKAKQDAKPEQAKKRQVSLKKRAARQLKRRDKDQDGSLTLEEFVVIPKKMTDAAKIENRKKQMARQFTRRDADKNGKLSLEELAKPQQKAKKKSSGDAAPKEKKANKDAKKKQEPAS